MGRPKSGKYVDSKCIICEKEFRRREREDGKDKYKFCSKLCSQKYMKGRPKTIIPLEERNWKISRKGYLETHTRGKRVLQHRWIMEKNIGRPLRKDEKVHHINGDKQDNRISNLVIMDDSSHSKTYKMLLKENAVMRSLLEERRQNEFM